MGMDDTLQTLIDWLEGQTNRTLMIQKKEAGDMDQVRLQLTEVDYRADSRSIDGYTDGSAIVLRGSGSIVTDSAEVPLPQENYVIPVDGLSVSKASEDGVIVYTDRAHYSLSVDESDRH